MPLIIAKTGEELTIKKISGLDETRKRLESLGFVVGETITVIAELAGNLIINIKGSRIALDKTLASRIMV